MITARLRYLVFVLAPVAFVIGSVQPAAATPPFEVGASLLGVTTTSAPADTRIIGIPSSNIGPSNPGVYTSIFVTPRLAFEPQVGLLWTSFGCESAHVFNVAGQVDYFTRGDERVTPFVFGGVGLLDASAVDAFPTISAGAGYRFRMGDRLTLRVDGRLTHFTSGGGDVIGFTASIGGLFGGR
jgi:hypothetical protein